jgi:hypothetical protein
MLAHASTHTRPRTRLPPPASSDLGPAALPPALPPMPASPQGAPDLLASIDEEDQLTLRYSRISAFVSTSIQPPSLLERARRASRGGEREPEERQILCSITGEILPGEVLALM